MQRPPDRYNWKRQIQLPPSDQAQRDALQRLAGEARYTGNPEHKKIPGDFGLTPPCRPRPDKTLCDEVRIFHRATAQNLLHKGISIGLISKQTRSGWPQNVWVVTDNGEPLEAQLENPAQGTYHGYPIPKNDPMHETILENWISYDR